MTKVEKRRENIIKKYGSREAYETLRAQRSRETALAKCSTEEERIAKTKKLEKRDMWKASIDPENIGKKILCSKCGVVFVAGTTQHLYCRKCVLEEARIERSGSLEAYFKESNAKNKETKEGRYGDSNYNNRTKATKTCVALYGGSTPLKSAAVRAKSATTKLEKYGDPTFNNKEKATQTNLKKYGVVSTAQLEEVKEKSRKTKKEKYEDEYYNNREKSAETCQERFGGNAPSSDPAVLKKIQSTMRANFGVKHPSQSKECQDRAKKALQEKFGVDNAMQNSNICNKSVQTRFRRYGSFINFRLYDCDSFVFDSTYELAYYIFLRDRKIPFNLKPAPLSYCDETGKSHNYYPDFLVEGRYVEIKGEYYIDEDGILVHPLTRKKLIEKTQCMRNNNVLILLRKDLTEVFSYVEMTYGKNYLKSLMRETKNDKN